MARRYTRDLPEGSRLMTTACQYCAVGCGYRAVLVPADPENRAAPSEADVSGEVEGISAIITDAMQSTVRYQGRSWRAAIAPDPRCDLNKGNHSVRGGSQGHNLVTDHKTDTSTKERLVSPMIRTRSGLQEIDWETASELVAALTVQATDLKEQDGVLKPETPGGLGVKLYEYQYLENTFAATHLFYQALATPNLAYHDRPSAAGSSPGVSDAGFGPHDFAYDDIRAADVVVFIGSNPYENQSVFFMQNCVGKELIVIDPRRSATADYAVKTGGMHLQPRHLGADSLLLYALSRALLEALPDEQIHPRIARTLSGNDRADMMGEGKAREKNKDKKKSWEKLRRASRALTLEEYRAWLGAGDPSATTYTLANAAQTCGLPLAQLQELRDRLLRGPADTTGRPRVALLYEKGLIWGFNYHNTAAVASLGLMLWRPDMPAPLTGRCGGHQKGWAESRDPAPGFPRQSGGYPYSNASDTYTDHQLLTLRSGSRLLPDFEDWDGRIKVRHNLDTHVFGPEPQLATPDQVCGQAVLQNGVHTVAKPDVTLLWIIGGNYLGQTHQAGWKQEKARKRRDVCGEPPEGIDACIAHLHKRIDEGGLVVIHQDIYKNPTTALADIVLPASGWGEDDFIRYNAERRLRLYERFQDPPLHAADQPEHGVDPLDSRECWKHSPRPDWMIFRDIAQQLPVKAGASAALRQTICADFSWTSSAQLADKMAASSNRTGMLGAILPFADAIAEGLDAAARKQLAEARVHTVLGRGGKGEAPLLRQYRIDGEGPIHSNGVASNGVLMPLSLSWDAHDRPVLKGTLRKTPGPDARLNFVRADWGDLSPWFEAVKPAPGELTITCGRVNHLWNNLYNHIRNETVLQRYPEDMPGTILEVNPQWAHRQGLSNGEIVTVENSTGGFTAVLSLQSSVADGGAFAMFSYPVRTETGFSFDGYANNLMHGYFDGINPIGALKYGSGKVTSTGRHFSSDLRPGPSYAERNRITDASQPDIRGTAGGRWSAARRSDWQMRELGVIRGLPRAFAHSGTRRQDTMLDPDATFRYLRSHLGGVFAMMLDVMKWPTVNSADDTGGRADAGRYDHWHGVDLHFARDVWARDAELEAEGGAQPVTADAHLPGFIAWSEALTGFDDLRDDPEHAQSVLARLLRRLPPGRSAELTALLPKLTTHLDQLTPEAAAAAAALPELSEQVAVLWYTGGFFGGFGFIEGGEGDEGFGTIAENHYRRGLVWRAAGVEPQGATTRRVRWDRPAEEES